MDETIKAILDESLQVPIVCEVTMDNKKYASDDFVCVLSKDNGDASFFYNTDALTLGMALKMISSAFLESMSELSEEDREAVNDILQLGGAR